MKPYPSVGEFRSIYLIRHGAFISDEDRAKLAQVKLGKQVPELQLSLGVPPDRGLTAEGRRQVMAIESWLEGELGKLTRANGIDFWRCEYDPTNTRTHTTANFLADDGAWRQSDLLHDRRWGTLGTKITRGMLQGLQRDSDDPFNWRPPGGGESVRDVAMRAEEFLKCLNIHSPRGIVIISAHGEVILGFRVVLESIDRDSFNRACRSRAFDAPDGIVMQYTDGLYANAGTASRCVRRVCPWHPLAAGFDGKWKDIPELA